MTQKFENFSMEEARRLAQTEAGQRLLSLLQSQNPQLIQKAMHQASSGDYGQLKETLGAFMASPEAQSLFKQLENPQHG